MLLIEWLFAEQLLCMRTSKIQAKANRGSCFFRYSSQCLICGTCTCTVHAVYFYDHSNSLIFIPIFIHQVCHILLTGLHRWALVHLPTSENRPEDLYKVCMQGTDVWRVWRPSQMGCLDWTMWRLHHHRHHRKDWYHSTYVYSILDKGEALWHHLFSQFYCKNIFYWIFLEPHMDLNLDYSKPKPSLKSNSKPTCRLYISLYLWEEKPEINVAIAIVVNCFPLFYNFH